MNNQQLDINNKGVSDVRPLADRLRPVSLESYFGQTHLLGQGKPLREIIETGRLYSMIFWGPPGTGKTTLAKLIAHYTHANFISLSAVLSGVKDIRAAVETAKNSKATSGNATILFVDEVHRFNKSQQDAFLPYVEDGTITFVGATTENPSFELNNALLSRARVYVLKSLQAEEIEAIIAHALTDEVQGVGKSNVTLTDEQLSQLVNAADGDARRALSFLEMAVDLAVEENGKQIIHEATLNEILTGSTRRFDNKGESFYDQISALHKSVRGSNPDAALYWFARMIDGGCDPLYIARRVVRMASEDIGNADPRGLEIALNAWDVQQRLGSPEGELAVAQAIVYLACCAKSNAVYSAFNHAMADAKKLGSLAVPLHLRNAPTGLMKELDYGKNYRYAHNEANGYAAGESYFPEEMDKPQYYVPVTRGLELKIKERLDHLRSLDKQHTT